MPETLPLAGLRVVVTRAAHQAEGLAEAFARAGARVELLPLLEVVPPADPSPVARAARRVSSYDWLVFTSANAVGAFLARAANAGGRPARLPPIAVVGPATAAAVREHGATVAFEAARSDAEGLAAELGPVVTGRRVLVPQAADARPTLAAGLAAAGARVETVVAYDKGLPEGTAERARGLFSGASLGWVTFTSPRIARHFAELLGGDWEHRRGELRAVSIGPVTSRELRRLGVAPAAEAETPSDEAMVAAVVAAKYRS